MSVINLTDQNGKVINCDVNKSILEVYDDYGFESNKCFTKIDDNENSGDSGKTKLQIIDSKGNPLDISNSEGDLNDITDIEIHIEATHSDRVINSAKYTGESMLRDAVTYIHPFNKPILKNHNCNSEPLGRIISSDCIDSAIVQGTKAVNIVARITDKDAIPKFLDGRYRTVSIGARPKTITCLHCGKHILKDGKFKFCGHWRGETYEDKVCLWKMEDLDYSELSVVNSPADKYAQVYKIVTHRKSDKNKPEDEENGLKDNEGNSLPDIIINSGDTETQPDDDQSEDTSIETNSYEVDSLKEQIKNLGEIINSLQSKNDELLNERRELEDKCDLYSIDFRNQSEKLSKISNMYKNDILEIINMSKSGNDILKDETSFKILKDNLKLFKENYKNNLNGNNQNNNSKQPNTPSVPKPVQNPGLVDNSNDKKIIQDNDNDNDNDNEENKYFESNEFSLDNAIDAFFK